MTGCDHRYSKKNKDVCTRCKAKRVWKRSPETRARMAAGQARRHEREQQAQIEDLSR
jgi:hypothetical protein